MEKELRKKFVIVTMSLMCLIFGIFFAASHFYYKYWYEMDTLDFVRWITESGVLLNEPSDSAGRDFIENNEEYTSINAYIFSENGDIRESIPLNSNCTEQISDAVLRKVFQNKDGWKTGHYIYDIKEISESRYLVVLANMKTNDVNIVKTLSGIVLIVLGISALFMLTIYLSGFVTRPARLAMQREKQFVSDASHELKTPLGAISINAQAIKITDENSKHIRNIIGESQRMGRLIEKLLTLSKIEETPDIQKTAFSLSSCTEEMSLTYESVAYDKGILYEYDIAENISLFGNEDDIRQLLAILIDNAIKHTESGGEIRINLCEKNGCICLSVTNSGKGISQNDLSHIFERFYKSQNTDNTHSFGLGLAIAKAVTERNNGHIYAESVPDKSTCFRVEFK